jgi:hypothetical protein
MVMIENKCPVIDEDFVRAGVKQVLTVRAFCGGEYSALRELAVEMGLPKGEWERHFEECYEKADRLWKEVRRNAVQ